MRLYSCIVCAFSLLLGACVQTGEQRVRDISPVLKSFVAPVEPAVFVPSAIITTIDAAKQHLEKMPIGADDLVLAILDEATGAFAFPRFSVSELNRRDKSVPESHTRFMWSGEHLIAWQRRLNGINTPFVVMHPERRAVVALKRTSLRGGKERVPTVYVPYTRHVDTPEMRARGHEYLRARIEEAQTLLRERSVMSRSFVQLNVADAVPLELALKIAVIEHIDHARFSSEPMEQLMNEVLVIVGANGADAYIAASSSASAYGLFQFIRKTYTSIRAQYPAAALEPDFVRGMQMHTNAAKASLLLFDSDLAQLPPLLRMLIRTHPEYLADYLAAMYNSGGAWNRMKKHGLSWRDHLPNETKVYLQKRMRGRDILFAP
jgi:hypothetical protein